MSKQNLEKKHILTENIKKNFYKVSRAIIFSALYRAVHHVAKDSTNRKSIKETSGNEIPKNNYVKSIKNYFLTNLYMLPIRGFFQLGDSIFNNSLHKTQMLSGIYAVHPDYAKNLQELIEAGENYKSNPEKFIKAMFYLNKMLNDDGNYQESLEHFNTFKDIIQKNLEHSFSKRQSFKLGHNLVDASTIILQSISYLLSENVFSNILPQIIVDTGTLLSRFTVAQEFHYWVYKHCYYYALNTTDDNFKTEAFQTLKQYEELDENLSNLIYMCEAPSNTNFKEVTSDIVLNHVGRFLTGEINSTEFSKHITEIMENRNDRLKQKESLIELSQNRKKIFAESFINKNNSSSERSL